MIIGLFELVATNSKSLGVISPEISGSDEDSGRSKISGTGALGIGMSVSCRYGFRADWQNLDKQFLICIFSKILLCQFNKNNNHRNCKRHLFLLSNSPPKQLSVAKMAAHVRYPSFCLDE